MRLSIDGPTALNDAARQAMQVQSLHGPIYETCLLSLEAVLSVQKKLHSTSSLGVTTGGVSMAESHLHRQP